MQRKKRYCRLCGEELVPERHSQYCFECGLKVQKEATRQIREKEGPFYEKWKRRWEEGVRRVTGEPVR